MWVSKRKGRKGSYTFILLPGRGRRGAIGLLGVVKAVIVAPKKEGLVVVVAVKSIFPGMMDPPGAWVEGRGNAEHHD